MSSFLARRRARRDAARERVLARVTEPMSPSQRAYDPLAQDAAVDGWSVAALALFGALAAHGSVYGAGAVYGALTDDDAPDRAPTKIVVRERPPEPTPPPPEPEPAPEEVAIAEVPEPAPVETPAEPPPEPKIKAKVEPPPAEPEPVAKPPPRIVGLDLGATSEGGTGGSFGAGNTRDGTSGDTAADPKKVKRGGTGTTDGKDPVAKPPKQPDPPNKTATKIPTGKAKMVMAKRNKPVTPPYPETLKSQGIEANVPVVVSIDEKGKVTEVKLAKSSGFTEFDEAARKAALAEKFEPATRDGVPVASTISYTYRFRLEDR